MARSRSIASNFVGRRTGVLQRGATLVSIIAPLGFAMVVLSMESGWLRNCLGLLLIYYVIRYVFKSPENPSKSEEIPGNAQVQHPAHDASTSPPVSVPNRIPPKKSVSVNDHPVSVGHLTSASGNSEFKLPPSPQALKGVRWIPAGESVDVAGLKIPGGLLYVGVPPLYVGVGAKPRSASNPALIDPNLRVAVSGDYRERFLNYWPNYSDVTPEARRAYLNWLISGRCDPEADIGFVFLYFYGLEYRVLADAKNDAAAKAEIPQIARELKRLIDIYGNLSGSFRGYAGGLYDLLSLSGLPKQLYLEPVPEFPKSYEVPVYIRHALGSAAVDGASVSASLAYAWIQHSPVIRLRTPALRCSRQFEQLFVHRYGEKFGEGMVLPRNKTKLKFGYRPASMALISDESVTRSFGDIPDVTVLTKPIKQLAELVESVTQELDAYSRYLAKNPEDADALEGVLLLPPFLWPEASRQALDDLKSKIRDGMLVISFQELLTTLGAKTGLTKDKAASLARALESLAIGVEPDILNGARMPKSEDKLALFAIPPGEVTSRATPAYQAAVLTLQLASVVASVDGEFSAGEMTHLRQQIEMWTHLTPSHIRRLKAHLRLLVVEPASLPALKKKLEPLDMGTKETLGAFMATIAQVDNKVSPDEVKMLEKIYKALGIDPKKVFSDVHAVATGSVPSSSIAAEIEETGLKLDPARIAMLQNDTAKVSAMLANIFSEEPSPEYVAIADEEYQEAHEPNASCVSNMMGLDEPHTAFARLIASRPQWTREELLDVASDLDLMLDGALERINEAAYDAYDAPFIEGDDPIEVNAEVLEKIEA